MLDADGEVTARSSVENESESLKTATVAIEAGRVADRTQPVSAGGSAQHDDLIMSHMRRELLGGGAEQSVISRNIDLLHGTSFLHAVFK